MTSVLQKSVDARHPSSERYRPFAAPRLAPSAAALARAWYTGCRFHVEIGEIDLSIIPTRPEDEQVGAARRINFALDGEVGFADVPESLLAEFLAPWNAAPASLSENSLLILLEYFADSLLSRIEDALGCSIVIQKMETPGQRAERPQLYALCEAGPGKYFLGLTLPPRQAAACATALRKRARARRSGGILVDIAFRLGSARLPAGVLKRVRPGDAILGEPMAKGGRMVMVAGERLLAAAQLQGDRITVLSKPAAISRIEEESWSMAETLPGRNGTIEGGDASFDDIQIKVTFEFARTEVRLDDLQKIAPGYVFDFSKSPKTAIDIYAGSRRIGHGEIVQVGDALGVRVTRLFNND